MGRTGESVLHLVHSCGAGRQRVVFLEDGPAAVAVLQRGPDAAHVTRQGALAAAVHVVACIALPGTMSDHVMLGRKREPQKLCYGKEKGEVTKEALARLLGNFIHDGKVALKSRNYEPFLV